MQQATAHEKKYIDLHIHTHFSDGTSEVKNVIDIAAEKGLYAISITDHDCIDAYPEAIHYGEKMGVEVIPGVELSSEIDGIDIHILGYYIDFTNEQLLSKLHEMKKARYQRAKKIVKNLNVQNIDLRFETVLKIAGEGAIGRPHIATAMLKEELIYSFREAFDKYIGYESPAYVEKLHMKPKEVFDLILQAGGIPILAHPGATKVDERIPEFIRSGLMGIEVCHPEHPPALVRHYKNICRKHGLAMTGGSDFHSLEQTKSDIGSTRAPLLFLQQLKNRLEMVRE